MTDRSTQVAGLRRALADIEPFSRAVLGRPLRPYQVEVAHAAEARDGIRRHFEITTDVVASANPLYGQHVASEISRLGEHHPIIQTQYLLKTLANAGRLLSADQLAALQGDHPPLLAPAQVPSEPALSDAGRRRSRGAPPFVDANG